MKKSFYFSLLFITSTVLVTLSPFIVPVKVTSLAQLREPLSFGFPFPFVEQCSTVSPAPGDLPIHVHAQASRNYCGSFTDFSALTFGLNVFLILLVLIISLALLRKIRD